MATVAMGAWLTPELLSCVLDVGLHSRCNKKPIKGRRCLWGGPSLHLQGRPCWVWAPPGPRRQMPGQGAWDWLQEGTHCLATLLRSTSGTICDGQEAPSQHTGNCRLGTVRKGWRVCSKADDGKASLDSVPGAGCWRTSQACAPPLRSPPYDSPLCSHSGGVGHGTLGVGGGRGGSWATGQEPASQTKPGSRVSASHLRR